jgi:nucleotide-binding universal stress UspA family protein
MFTHIVVPLDGTRFAEAALTPAQALARAFQAQIVVVRVVAPTVPPRTALSWDERQGEVERLDEADAYLHGIVDELRTSGCQANVLLHIGEPGAGIAHAAASGHAGVIVMAAHPRWKADALARAGTTLKVLAKTHIPILAWRAPTTQVSDGELVAQEQQAFLAHRERPILVALDGSRFAEHALELAETLACTFGLPLVLTRAITPAASPAVERTEERAAMEYLQGIRRAVERRGVPRAMIVLRHGTPLRVIERACREFHAGLIVLASHGRSDPAGTFLGSTAARLIEEVVAPVLVVRPEPKEEQFLDKRLRAAPVAYGTAGVAGTG